MIVVKKINFFKMKFTKYNLKITILAILVLLISIIFSLEFTLLIKNYFLSNTENLMNIFPSDIHFYLNYAKNMAQGDFYSWNGISPSNGFHPLWAILLTPIFWFTTNITAIYKITISIQFILFLLLCTTVLIFILKQKNKVLALLSLLLVVSWAPYLYDGMETALASFSLMLFIALIFSSLKKKQISKKGYLILGLVTTGVFLSRLDLILFTGPIIIYFLIKKLLPKKKNRFKISKALLFLSPPTIILGIYLLINKLYVGSFMPLSGAVKSTFPHVGPFIEHSLSKSSLGVKSLILTGLLLFGWFILTKIKKENKKYFSFKFLTLLFFGAILHLAYHVLFTYATEIGSWYFVYHIFLSILTLVFLLDFSIREIINKETKELKIKWSSDNSFRKKIVLALSSLGSVLIILFISTKVFLAISDKLKKIQKQNAPDARTSIVKEAAKDWKYIKPDKYKIFDGTDGQFAYFSGMPTYHAKGMANTPDFVKVRQKLIETTRKKDHDEAERVLKKYFHSKGTTHVVGYKRWSQRGFPNKCLKKHEFIFKNLNKIGNKFQLVYIMDEKEWLKMFDNCNINEFGLVWNDSLESW
jgi:hypothetical protein